VRSPLRDGPNAERARGFQRADVEIVLPGFREILRRTMPFNTRRRSCHFPLAAIFAAAFLIPVLANAAAFSAAGASSAFLSGAIIFAIAGIIAAIFGIKRLVGPKNR
jgi:hypothetical protein